MAELSERAASGFYQLTENAEAEATTLNQSALEFMFGAQRMMFQEFVFVTDEMLERNSDRNASFSRSSWRKWRARIPSRTSGRCVRNAASISSISFAATSKGCSGMANG